MCGSGLRFVLVVIGFVGVAVFVFVNIIFVVVAVAVAVWQWGCRGAAAVLSTFYVLTSNINF